MATIASFRFISTVHGLLLDNMRGSGGAEKKTTNSDSTPDLPARSLGAVQVYHKQGRLFLDG